MDDAHEQSGSQLPEDSPSSARDETPAPDEKPATDETPGKPSKRGSRLDRGLNIAVLVTLISILSLGIWFFLNVRSDRLAEEEANPALRIVRTIEGQVRDNPNDAILRVRLAEALGAAGKYDAAVDQLNAALEIEPQHVGAYLDLGIIALETEEEVAAERYFLRVVELTEVSEFGDVDQRREVALYNLGRLAIMDERYEDAIANLKASQRIRKDASDTYYHLALAYKGLEEYDAAIEQLEIALAFDPNYAAAYYQLGTVHMAQGDLVNASFAFHQAGELEPDADIVQEALAAFGAPEDLIASAREKLEAGDVEGALNDILIARNLDPESVEAAVLHGDIALAKGDPKAALAVYEEALALASDEEDAEIQAKIDGIGE